MESDVYFNHDYLTKIECLKFVSPELKLTKMHFSDACHHDNVVISLTTTWPMFTNRHESRECHTGQDLENLAMIMTDQIHGTKEMLSIVTSLFFD